MRFEAPHFMLVGALVFVVAILVSHCVRASKLRAVALSAVFAVTLGVALFPGHGELVVVPALALLTKGGKLAGIGAVFALGWFLVALVLAPVCLRVLRRLGTSAA
jgi:hypothetical protein